METIIHNQECSSMGISWGGRHFVAVWPIGSKALSEWDPEAKTQGGLRLIPNGLMCGPD
jgi:hypothetical protein